MNRSGFTLLELVVVVAISSLLITVLLVSVSAIRESSRRTQCQARLRDLSLATLQYENDFGKLPATHQFQNEDRSRQRVSNYQVLLPYLGHPALPRQMDESPFLRSIPLVPLSEIAAMPLAVFLCPSDPVPGGCNLRFNSGSNASRLPANTGWPESGNGPFDAYHRGLNFVTDGLSNTAAFSERLKSRTDGRFDYRRDIAIPNVTSVYPFEVQTTALMIEISRRLDLKQASPYLSTAGNTWCGEGFHYTVYNHVDPPNALAVPLTNGHETHSGSMGIVPATSEHPGGVNVSLLDGSVRFVNDEIDPELYRQLGSAQDSIESVGGLTSD